MAQPGSQRAAHEHKSDDAASARAPEADPELEYLPLAAAHFRDAASFAAPPPTPRTVVAFQRAIGNRAVQRTLAPAVQRSGTFIQRALLSAMTGEPTYQDGLTLATIIASAKDLTPRPVDPGSAGWGGGKMKNTRAAMKAVFGTDDQSKWDLNSPLLLQVGEVHGNQLYLNKSGDLPAGPVYKEYDIATYKGDPAGRGHDRVVIGTAGSTLTYYYTSNHYTDFAPFTPAAAASTTATATPISPPTPVTI